MMNRNRFISMVGMAYKAGKVVSGADPVRYALKKKKVKLLIVAEDASFNTKQKFINSAVYYNVPYIIYLTKEELSKCLGNKIRSVAGIVDNNFARQMKTIMEVNSK